MKLGIAEIFRKASEIPARKDKIEFLRKHYTPTMGSVLQLALDKAFVWDLPPGAPPYKESPSNGDQQYVLYQQMKKMGKFLKPPHSSHPNMKPLKREMLFIQLLETCDPEDAELLIAIKDKKLPYKGFTVALIDAAFPGLIVNK